MSRLDRAAIVAALTEKLSATPDPDGVADLVASQGRIAVAAAAGRDRCGDRAAQAPPGLPLDRDQRRRPVRGEPARRSARRSASSTRPARS